MRVLSPGAPPKFLEVASASLTTATTAYSAGDQVGALLTFANFALASGGGGYIESIVLHDMADIIGAYTVFLFRASVTLASDNAAFAISDADNLNLITGGVYLGRVEDTGANRVASWVGSIPYTLPGGTSLYAGLRTDAGHTFFGAATDLKLDITASVLA